ncbi:GNAT family N-acetyltransferase [Nocardioides sp. InS609-2]|uniref:GNAT family N-acetyltransferase n=1 Tax=Nocardioides sp. InS609-2 TaxID=2760705 RepID=UPI0020C055A3|nr:GNAT family N-acetyltransferase [Nocardioides sp. InS609-2]
MTDWRHHRTERLWLDVAAEADVDDLHAIHGDPGTWRHFPQGRHTTREQSAQMVGKGEAQWDAHGLGNWSVRERVDGPVIGRGGCAVPDHGLWWNLYYRFAPSAQGQGYAAEMARTAIEAAHDVAPERPVVAYLLEHNHASAAVAGKVGLELVWRGPDAGNDDPDAVRLVFADREIEAALLRSAFAG